MERTVDEFVDFCKNLQSTDFIRSLKMFSTIVDDLEETFTVSQARDLMQQRFPNVLFYKGQQVRGYVEQYFSGEESFRYNEKCNVEKLLWSIGNNPGQTQRRSKQAPFHVLLRIGRGKYTLLDRETLNKHIVKIDNVLCGLRLVYS